MFPQIKLAMMFTMLAKKHGAKILHANNVDLLTRDLSHAMQEQKQILSNPRKGSVMTAYDVLPVILEVKLLTVAVARHLDVEIKGRSTIDVLEDIIQKCDERNSGKYAKGIRDTLEWTRRLNAHPEIQDIWNMQMTEINMPRNIRDVPKFVRQVAGRSADELNRVNEFLKRAKDLGDDDNGDAKPAPSTPKPV